MKKLLSIILILSLPFASCELQNTPVPPSCKTCIDSLLPQILDSLQRVSGESVQRASATGQKDVTSLLYTEAQARLQFAKTPNVKKPLDTFWYNIQPDYLTNGQMHEIEESFEYFFEDIMAGLPFEREYSWEYSTPYLRGQYLYVTDRNKAIVPQFQKDMDALVEEICEEYGFYIASNQKDVPGYYQKFSIKQKAK